MAVILRNGESVPSIEADGGWEKISNIRNATKPYYRHQPPPSPLSSSSSPQQQDKQSHYRRLPSPMSITPSPPPFSAYAIRLLGPDLAHEFQRLFHRAKSSPTPTNMQRLLNGPVPMVFSFSFMPEDIIGCPTAYYYNIANPRPKRIDHVTPPMPFLMVDRVMDLTKTGYTVFVVTPTNIKLVELDYRAKAQPKISLYRYHDASNAPTSLNFNKFFKWTKKTKEGPLSVHLPPVPRVPC